MANILVFDNYDSFTWNLVHYVRETDKHSLDVARNDQIALEEIDFYDGIILSPGPGIPEEAGMLLKMIGHYYKKKRIFGVCLGLQAITQVFGGQLVNIEKVYHGVATPVEICTPRHYLFNDLASGFMAGRYHSWMADSKGFPEQLRVDAIDQQGRIMAISHKEYDVCGVQFHPESILTPDGKTIIQNWLSGFNNKEAKTQSV